MNKRVFAFLTALILLLALCVPAFAAPEDAAFNAMVLDTAELLPAQQEEELNQRAWNLTERYGCAVYMITVPGLEGMEAWEFSEYLFDGFGLGYGEENSCIILLLSMEYRDYDIMAHGYGNTAFTDYGKEVMAERFLPDFGDDDWYGGFEEYLDCCEEFLQLAEEGTPFDVDSEKHTGGAVLISVAVGLLAAFITCAVFKGQMKTARIQQRADTYISPEGLILTSQAENFLYKSRSVRHIEQDNDSDRGGTTVNRHGSSHSSGKF